MINGKLDNTLLGLSRGDPVYVSMGCEDRCAQHECWYGSKCVEKFDTKQVKCVCKNNITHSGEHCEKS